MQAGSARLQCETASRHDPGFALVELIVVCAIASAVVVAALPDARDEARRVEAGATQLAWHLRGVRAEAAREGLHTAVVFTAVGADYEFRVYADGNDNGVGTADVRAGVDVPAGPAARLSHLARGIRFGIPRTVPDPAGSGTLVAGSAPVRFGTSGIASFSPEGTSTSGTVYVTGELGTLFAVRVLGTTGRVRVLRWDDWTGAWVSQ